MDLARARLPSTDGQEIHRWIRSVSQVLCQDLTLRLEPSDPLWWTAHEGEAESNTQHSWQDERAFGAEERVAIEAGGSAGQSMSRHSEECGLEIQYSITIIGGHRY